MSGGGTGLMSGGGASMMSGTPAGEGVSGFFGCSIMHRCAAMVLPPPSVSVGRLSLVAGLALAGS
jgi:hypothetical protein